MVDSGAAKKEKEKIDLVAEINEKAPKAGRLVTNLIGESTL